MTGSADRPQSSEQRLATLTAGRPSPQELGDLLDSVGERSQSRRRRLQAELLGQGFADLAALAARCGWKGKVIASRGKVLVEQEGVVFHALPEHFRTQVLRRGPILARFFTTLGIPPETIVEFGPTSGEAVIYLARRFPQARVILAEPDRDRREAVYADLALQSPALTNLEIVGTGLPGDGDFEGLRRRLGTERIDLCILEAGTFGPEHLPVIRELVRTIRAASVDISAALPPEARAGLLEAFRSAGLVALEKGASPAADPGAWIEARLAEHPVHTLRFVRRDALDAYEQRQRTPARTRPAREPFRSRRILAWLYSRLDRLRRRADPKDQRFEFERIYSASNDPWLYRTNPYETVKYFRTLDTALALAPRTGAALEIACSIGVFTRLLARTFSEVTAVDVAAAALAKARRTVGPGKPVRFVRSDLRSLDLGRTFDVIFCAEMLYYFEDEDTAAILEVFRRHLAADGVLVTVMPHLFGRAPAPHTPRWRRRLIEAGFDLVFEGDYPEGGRPYVIQAYRPPRPAEGAGP